MVLTLPTPGGGTNTWGTELNDWLTAKHAGFFNVLDYEAVEGGITDCLATFQAAIDAADGAPVIIPAGDWLIDGTLTRNGDTIRLVGAGKGRTRLLSASNPAVPVIEIADADIVELSGFSLIAQGTATSEGHGISIINAAQRVTLRDIISDGFVHPIHLAGEQDGTPANDVYALRYGGTLAGGTYTIGAYLPESADLIWTGTIAWNANAATIQTAMQTAFGSGDVTVTGSSPTFTVTFAGDLAGVALLMVPWVNYDNITGSNTPTVSMWRQTQAAGPYLQDVVLDRVEARNSPNSWGIHCDNIDDLTLNNCIATGNYLDGVKLRQRVNSCTILGGHYDNNGTSMYRTSGATSLGDGLDGYTGGRRLKIVGATFNNNSQNGIQIKNDGGATDVPNTDISGIGAAGWGIAKQIDIIGVECNGSKVGSGLVLTQIYGEIDYAVCDVTVVGGQFDYNGDNGIMVQSRRTTLIGCRARRNQFAGINIHAHAREWSVIDCDGIANGVAAGWGYGLSIDGSQVGSPGTELEFAL